MNIGFLSLKIAFVLANSADPDEMLHYVPFMGFSRIQRVILEDNYIKIDFMDV